MGIPVLTAREAWAASHEPTRYLLRLVESEAPLFRAPGWKRLDPPRDGAVLFLHQQRELLAVRVRGVL